ncbi:glycosyltransferase [Pseudidiomarina sp.]|uniref:glycosyltransferase n=1 Tax=Pseudidiomarina sp. TaxID=2081707 RepID=UPI00299D3835|nr:glycosyltransferase [Pseudidiomarina sp.]MDX1705949.1 glycosyltransferase [Pseudidiomarina sp.]
MKIVHLVLTHSFAGSERYAAELANLHAQHHEVAMILHRRGAEERANAIVQHLDPKVRIHLVSGPKWLASWRARRLIRQLEPDVAHAHLSAACKALKGIGKHILCVASLHLRYKPGQHAHMDALVAVAPWQLAEIPPLLRQRSRQIDNWTIAAAPAVDARAKLREQWGVSDADFVVGTLGRVEANKGHEVLIEAFRAAAIPDTRLVIVGKGKALEQLQQSAAADVVLAGFSSRPQDCYAAFDGFASSARAESFGLVFLEAMNAGLPMVATATEGACYLREYFVEPPVPVDDVDALAAAIKTLVAQGKQRIDYPMQRFSPADRAQEIIDFYRQQLSGN